MARTDMLSKALSMAADAREGGAGRGAGVRRRLAEDGEQCWRLP